MAKKDFSSAMGSSKKDDVLSSLIRGKKNSDSQLKLEWLPHSKVYSVKQVRFKFKELEGLAASMKGRNQHEAIRVFPADADGKYRIHVGERRWRAATINDEPVLAIVDSNLNPETYNAKNILGQIAENDQREPLTPIELGMAFAELRDQFGLKTAEIAEGIGRKPAYVSKHLKLLEMPKPVQDLLEEGIVTYIETLNILTNIFGVSDIAGNEVVAYIRENGDIGRNEAQTRLNQLKEAVKSGVAIESVPNLAESRSGTVSKPVEDNSNSELESDVEQNVNNAEDSDFSNNDIQSTVSEPLVHSNIDVTMPSEVLSPAFNEENDELQTTENKIESSKEATLSDSAAISGAAHLACFVMIDDIEYILLDKPSYTENGEEYVYCQIPGETTVMEVPVSECVLKRVGLTK